MTESPIARRPAGLPGWLPAGAGVAKNVQRQTVAVTSRSDEQDLFAAAELRGIDGLDALARNRLGTESQDCPRSSFPSAEILSKHAAG